MSNNIDLYIQELENAKVDIKDAIIAKGVTPIGGLSSYADAIDSIEIPTFETETLSVELTENGTYNYTPTKDGYSSVEVTVDIEIPTFETETLSVELTENGTYNYTPTKDGYSSVEVVVDVAGSGGDTGKPKIYNGFKLLSTSSTLSTSDRLTTKLKEVDFTQYDWSNVYDLTEFFGGFMKNNSYGAGAFVDSDFDNFRAGYNGQMVSCKDMFKTAPGAASNYTLKEVPDFSMFTDKLINMSGAFYGTELMFVDNITKWNTSNVVDMSYMFSGCYKLTSIPVFDTSSVVNMDGMFSGCFGLKSLPQLDYSKAISIGRIFSGCNGLTEIPDLDISSATSFMGNVTSSWIYNSSQISKIGVLQCDNIANVMYIFGQSNNTKITDFGGCVNLGKVPSGVANTNSDSAFKYAPNLTYQSVLNILNGLYDRASAGYSVLTLKLHANHLAMLSDDDIAIATNKGWTLV